MMINRRRVCGGKKVLLPSGYKQLEYIENTSNAYIDTGYIPNQDTKVDSTFMFRTFRNKPDFIYGSETPRYSLLYYKSYGNFRCDYNATMQNNFASIQVQIKYNTVQDKNKVYIDDILKYSFNYADFTCKYNLLIFACNSLGRLANTGVELVMYHFKIFNDNVLVRNFIPCINPNNVVGMYDTVNGVFYSSPNGTAFVAGPEV